MPPPRRHVLLEANYQQLLAEPPNLAILGWGATEAHNYHLPHGTDVIEAQEISEQAALLAVEQGAKAVVLPTIPYGNNEQQLDQVATISFQTSTAIAILDDVARSLTSQGINRLIVLNAHGGNEFKPIVRDIQERYGMLIVVANFYAMCPEELQDIFDDAGDHAGEMETSLLLHLCPDLVELPQAGPGNRIPFAIDGMNQPGVWTPRPWSRVHPDTGSGDPAAATADKGQRFFDAVTKAVAKLIVGVSKAKPGDLPLRES
jgi:creatinine amidohydrolase